MMSVLGILSFYTEKNWFREATLHCSFEKNRVTAQKGQSLVTSHVYEHDRDVHMKN